MATVLDVLQTELEETLESRKDALAYGHAVDYAEYRHLVGVITGLTSALERLKDLQKHYEDI